VIMLAASLMRQRSRYTGQTGASQSGIADKVRYG